MKLLIVTQVVNEKDPVLGFFVNWISELAKHYERVEVICLFEGEYHLPSNVRVYSLGKERGTASRATYAFRFLTLAWQLRSKYNTVFVHMNQEYVLLAGWLWKLLGKPIYLWRNHYAGSWLTDLAIAFCANVFCTSHRSYTARRAKTRLMPVGVDRAHFSPGNAPRAPHSILFLARMAPSKRPHMLLDALTELHGRGISFRTQFVGSPLPQDEDFYKELTEKVKASPLAHAVTFSPGVPKSETPALFQAHELFVNTSPSGMFDKTIYEALSSGALPLAASSDWAEHAGYDLSFTDATTLADRLEVVFALSQEVVADRAVRLQSALLEQNSLQSLAEELSAAMVA